MAKKTTKFKKAIKSSPEYDSERETRVLLEHVKDQVSPDKSGTNLSMGLRPSCASLSPLKGNSVFPLTTPRRIGIFQIPILQVGLVAEQHGTIVKKLDNYGTEFERVNNKLNRIEDKMMKIHIDINANSQKINRVEEKLDTALIEHDQKIKQIEEKIGI